MLGQSSGLAFPFAVLRPEEEQEQSQAVHSTGVFLLENHSNVSECIGNYGGLLGVRCLLS